MSFSSSLDFLSNIFAWRSPGGYWGYKAENAPLTHFWSLGIEEQFYLFFPLLFFFLYTDVCARKT